MFLLVFIIRRKNFTAFLFQQSSFLPMLLPSSTCSCITSVLHVMFSRAHWISSGGYCLFPNYLKKKNWKLQKKTTNIVCNSSCTLIPQQLYYTFIYKLFFLQMSVLPCLGHSFCIYNFTKFLPAVLRYNRIFCHSPLLRKQRFFRVKFGLVKNELYTLIFLVASLTELDDTSTHLRTNATKSCATPL